MKTMDEDDIQHELQKALDDKEHIEHPAEIIRHDDATDISLLEEDEEAYNLEKGDS